MNQVVLFAVSSDDKIELLDQIPRDELRFEVLPAEGTTYGEPVTIAVIALSSIAVSGLVAYLLKGRRSGRITIGHIRIDTPRGSLELRDVELEFSEEQEASKQMLNALQRWIAFAIPASQ